MGRDLKKLFPFFKANKGVVYFNNASTTQKPREMISALSRFEKKGLDFQSVLNSCRKKVAKLLSCGVDEVFFVSQGCTVAFNYLARECLRKKMDHVITSEAEHHANFLPWLQMARQVDIVSSGAKNGGALTVSGALLGAADVLSLSARSNVAGRLWNKDWSDLVNVVNLAHDNNCLVFLDAAQAALQPGFDLNVIAADAVAFSAHKIYGPTNLGILFIRKNVQSKVVPPSQSLDVLPTLQVIEFERTLNFLERQRICKSDSRLKAIVCDLVDFLRGFDFVKIISNPQDSSIVSFTTRGIHSHDLVDLLSQHKVYLRAGNHCAKPLHDALGVSNSTRISLACYNDWDDVRVFKKAFVETVRFLGGHELQKL